MLLSAHPPVVFIRGSHPPHAINPAATVSKPKTIRHRLLHHPTPLLCIDTPRALLKSNTTTIHDVQTMQIEAEASLDL
jgi:hypothetical protein